MFVLLFAVYYFNLSFQDLNPSDTGTFISQRVLIKYAIEFPILVKWDLS